MHYSHILAAIERARNDDLDKLSAGVTQDWANKLLTDREGEALHEAIRRRRWALKKPKPNHAGLGVVQAAAKGRETPQPKARRNYRRKDAFEDQIIGDKGLKVTDVRVAWALVREFYWDKGSVRETLGDSEKARH